jgi:type I restriction enzyme M protein
MNEYGYSKDRIKVEYPIQMGSSKKLADIVIIDKDNPNHIFIVVEVKKPKSKDGKAQLKSYCSITESPIGVLTNGETIEYFHRTADLDTRINFQTLTQLPTADKTLSDILNIKYYFKDLEKIDKLSNNEITLKKLVQDMEDIILANAGVDIFEEMFKLIFTKLYDEHQSINNNERALKYRADGYTETELKNNIDELFEDAQEQWEGIFQENTKITLTSSHLKYCINAFQDIKLFNSNIEVVDEAFEYLVNKSSKGEKGQYFTPRYVIDMCVKMMNPQEDEYMIDTASGSCGFTIHTIFEVWKNILKAEGKTISHTFTADKKTDRQIKYVRDKVFAIDFDERAVRVGRTLNLIAGDGQTNVLHLNTLDYARWNEWEEKDNWKEVYGKGFKKLNKLKKDKKSNESFNFDIVMANPPFAGDIRESSIFKLYELGRLKDKTMRISRDILFIERNIKFLKNGGRMAVVLPQGRFNNSSDKFVRDFIASKCRILAVVGLHGNVFKPHTGTKTSVLIVQKWDDELCPKKEDYNIFFATMGEPSKDNSGEKIYVKNEDGTNALDNHDHLIVKHDLFNHDGVTQDGIAEAFNEFAKKENLSFSGK